MSKWSATLCQSEKDRLESLRRQALALLDETINLRQETRKAERRGRGQACAGLRQRLREADEQRRAIVVQMKLIFEHRRLMFETYVWHFYGSDLRQHRRARLSRAEHGPDEGGPLGVHLPSGSSEEVAPDEPAMWAHFAGLVQGELCGVQLQALRLEDAMQLARRTADETALFESSAALAEASVSEEVFQTLLAEAERMVAEWGPAFRQVNLTDTVSEGQMQPTRVPTGGEDEGEVAVSRIRTGPRLSEDVAVD
jgi:hypothetical protein